MYICFLIEKKNKTKNTNENKLFTEKIIQSKQKYQKKNRKIIFIVSDN